MTQYRKLFTTLMLFFATAAIVSLGTAFTEIAVDAAQAASATPNQKPPSYSMNRAAFT
jgi:hypothetical protein